MVEISKNIKLISPAHVRMRKAHDEAMLIDLETLNCFGINAIGVIVWEGIRAHGTVTSVIEYISQEFDVEKSAVEYDVYRLVNELIEHGLLISTETSKP